MTDIKTAIKDLITTNDVVVYMRGTPNAPRCGFSATVVEIMKRVGAPYTAVNADENHDHWEALAEINDWPTMPQIFVKGEFIGGCDILREMYQSGELEQLLHDKGVTHTHGGHDHGHGGGCCGGH
ncbi:MAG: Grx4 family monothiol glutaredoxin [Alphaproteobacteria bacterium]|nr:MAG: Grx4 family monothiol glutaredoxin [Alphaproteobacteria bacterium]